MCKVVKAKAKGVLGGLEGEAGRMDGERRAGSGCGVYITTESRDCVVLIVVNRSVLRISHVLAATSRARGSVKR